VVSGRLGASGRLRFDAHNWDSLELALAFSPLCKVVAEPTAIAQLNQGTLPLALPQFVKLKGLPAHVVGAFLTAEDGGFRRHQGFDVEMIRRALAHDLAMGSLSKGASTLSQQVAKNLFLTPERTIARKLAELVLTWRLEEVLGKDRILELYLNIVELGPNLRGIGAAASRYFGKPAEALTPLEAAHLASLLPNPVGFARRFREGRVDDGWLHKLYDLLGRMQRSGLLSSEALQRSRNEALDLRKL
jgi:membrane peptidoglycan carboxypeptidase